jgi:monothiol glutaredoxin
MSDYVVILLTTKLAQTTLHFVMLPKFIRVIRQRVAFPSTQSRLLQHRSLVARSFASTSAPASAPTHNGVAEDDNESDDAFKPIRHAKPATPPVDDKPDYNVIVHKLVTENPIFLFMKGTPQYPRCGFSAQVVNILKNHKVDFRAWNIIEDDYAICDAVEAYRNWPTYPQLFVSGELVGGCDIVSELHRSGELAGLLASAKAIAPPSNPTEAK